MKAQGLTKETILNYGTQDRNFPEFNIGDTIEVAQKIKEGEKERLQLFKGYVIARHNKGISSTFTVRKLGANSIGVERIFPYYSANVDSIKVVKKGKVRRAKLNYLRERVGRSANVKELIITKEQAKVLAASKKAAKLAAKQAAQAQKPVQKTVKKQPEKTTPEVNEKQEKN